MKKNLKIKILIGIPASGKSTWTKNFLRNNEGWVRVSRDDFRGMLENKTQCEPKIENLISDLVTVTIHKSLTKRLNIIVDNTNCKIRSINGFIEEFKYSADIEFQLFDISVKKAIERDSQRTNPVGEDVINKMFEEYKILCDLFNFQTVTQSRRPHHVFPELKYSKLPSCVLFDMDGTLALMGKRGAFEWDKVCNDEVNPIVAEQARIHSGIGRKIIIVSGRDEVCREDTKYWLDFHNIPYDELFMRPKDDFRKDTIVKKEIYENDIKDKYNVICVYDDRLSVLNMWTKLGVYTFNVNQHNLEF